MLTVRHSPLTDIAQNLALEWARVQALDTTTADVPLQPELLFYVNGPCVVLGRSRKAAVDLTEAALAAPEGFLVRRRSGGGTVYHDEHNLNFSVLVPRDWPGLPSDPKCSAHHLLGAVVAALGADAAIERISDVTVRGKKVSGNAQYRGRRVLLHHGTLLLRADKTAMVRWLTLPPERPDVRHEDFVTDLATLGLPADADHWRGALTAAFGQLLNTPTHAAEFDDPTLAQARADAPAWSDPAWVRRL